MDIKEAIEILEHHQNWRCDNNVPSIYEPTNPKKLTNAINTALDKLKSDLLHSVSHCPLCNSENLHQYKLHHIHCKDCKENFDKSCD